MNVERSKHDELWTTRRRVTINVESLTWNVDDGDHWWDADWLATTSAVPLPTGRSHDDWRRSLRTPRMIATVTAMTYAATCHWERVRSTTAGLWCMADVHVHSPVWELRSYLYVNFDTDDHAYTVAITVWLRGERGVGNTSYFRAKCVNISKTVGANIYKFGWPWMSNQGECFNDRVLSLRGFDHMVFDTCKQDCLKSTTRSKRRHGKAPVLYQVTDDTSIEHVTMSRFLSHEQAKAGLEDY